MCQPPLGAGKVHDATSGGEKGREVPCAQRPCCAGQGPLASPRLQVSTKNSLSHLFVHKMIICDKNTVKIAIYDE